MRVPTRLGEIVNLLLKDSRIQPSEHNNKALILASSNGYVDILRLLLADERTNAVDTIPDIIGIASNNGHLEVMLFLLQNLITRPHIKNYIKSELSDIDIDNLNDETIAIKWLYMTKRLHKAFISVASFGNNELNHHMLIYYYDKLTYDDLMSALIAAVENGHKDIVKIILSYDIIDTLIDNNMIVRRAAQNGHLDMIELLLTDKRISIFYNFEYINNSIFVELVKEKSKNSSSGLAAIISLLKPNWEFGKAKPGFLYTISKGNVRNEYQQYR